MDNIDELLTRGVDKIYPSKEALAKVLRSGKKLRLYQGFDPSGIQLHIGHMTGLMKLRQFQELGHHVIFLIGDGTGQAGDPSGKTRTREKFLTNKELRENAKDYVMQAGKIVRFSGENATEILYNGDWLNKLGLVDILNIAGHFSLQQLEERDLYVERKRLGEEINVREFLYPLLQGYDSVAMNVDLELGGTDQTFNMLAGRKLVREMQDREKFVMTTPLLTDSAGKKIGKTEGNVIALTAVPNDLYGMIMNLPDEVIGPCFERLTNLPLPEVKEIEEALRKDTNPMILKKKLAHKLVEILNDAKDADTAQAHFERTFQKRELPKDVPVIRIAGNVSSTIIDVLAATKLVGSKSEARRLIAAGAVEINGEKCTDQNTLLSSKGTCTIRVGKHTFAKVITE